MSKTVLITGASSGIGEATAQFFLQRGWQVAATMRSRSVSERESRSVSEAESPNRVKDYIKAANIIYPYLDVTKPASIQSAIDETISQFGHIDVLVNNAGYALMGPLEGLTPKQIERQFQVNVFGIVATIQAILPIFRQQNSGTIINVASIGGRLAFPLTSAYHATKWAVEGLSESLRYELNSFNIKVKIIEPGGIKTNFINRGTIWETHLAYGRSVERMKKISEGINDSLPGPMKVAEAIFKAATERSQKLRYSPHGKAFLLIHAILPDWLWRTLITQTMLG